MPNSAIVPNPPQMPATPQEYVKYLLKMRGYTVQRLCDETGLVKSTMDKWLAGQTMDTSYTNVQTAVKKLGGSLNYLAQIENDSEPEPAPPVAKEAKETFSSNPSMELANFLVESYEKEIRRNAEHHQLEIQRVTAVHEKYLADVTSLVETGRQALITQHAAAIQHTKDMNHSTIAHVRELCDAAVLEKQKHLESFKGGRDFWRGCAVVLAGVVLAMAIWLVWEFSNLDLGLTGYLLREAGLISMAGPGGV